MFSHYYILSFFDQGLIVMICFFFFLFFAILMEKGLLASLSSSRSEEARSKLSRHLAVRESMIWELANYVRNTVAGMRNIAASYGTTSRDIILRSGYIIKKLLHTSVALQTRHYSDSLVARIQYLSSETKSYFARVAFRSSKKNASASKSNTTLVLL